MIIDDEVKSKKLIGSTTNYLYYWDEIYGWVHISEKEKLKEAYERFKEEIKNGTWKISFLTRNHQENE